MDLSTNYAANLYKQPVANQQNQGNALQAQAKPVSENAGLSLNQQQQVQQTNEESGANYDINKEASARNAQLVNILV